MSQARATIALLLSACATLACQQPDVGDRCRLTWGETSAAPTPSTTRGDYLETGNFACENFICIVSPVTSGEYSRCPGANPDTGDQGSCGYCSKRCVSDDDCYKSETGLECREMVLDEDFINSLPEDVRQKYLGEVGTSTRYCAAPR